MPGKIVQPPTRIESGIVTANIHSPMVIRFGTPFAARPTVIFSTVRSVAPPAADTIRMVELDRFVVELADPVMIQEVHWIAMGAGLAADW